MDDTPPVRRVPRSGIGYLFLGPDGLRAGWSILLFFALVFAGSYAMVHLVPKSMFGSESGVMRADGTIVGEAFQFAIFAIAALIMSFIERRPFERYGIRRSNIVPDFLKGLVSGVVMLSLLVGALDLSGGLTFSGVALGGGAAIGYGAEWLVAFLLVGLFEEFSTRGYLQFTLARGVAGIVRASSPGSRHAATIGFWIAAFVFSIGLFAIGHLANPGESGVGILAVALAGLVFVFSLYWTGSLWWAIGFHASWDWAQSYLYGVKDSGLAAQGHLLISQPAGSAFLSGGTTGPEGSILVVPTLLLTLVVIWKTMPRRLPPIVDGRT